MSDNYSYRATDDLWYKENGDCVLVYDLLQNDKLVAALFDVPKGPGRWDILKRMKPSPGRGAKS